MAFLVPAIDHVKVRDGLVTLAAFADLRHPGRLFVGEQIDGGFDRDGLDGIGLNRQRGVGFGIGFLRVVVFERHSRHQFVRLVEFRIGIRALFERIRSPLESNSSARIWAMPSMASAFLGSILRASA